MQLQIKTYSGQEADFYIQAKGLNAGRPLKNPKANCFAVTCIELSPSMAASHMWPVIEPQQVLIDLG